MAVFALYNNNPTAGQTNGARVSEGGDQSNPITATITVTPTAGAESSPIKLAIRCDSGYRTVAGQPTTIQPVGPTADQWALAPDNNDSPGTWGAWGAALTISSQITDVNTVFWAKARAAATDTPYNDTSVRLQATATTEAV